MLIIAIAFAVLYFGFPDSFEKFLLLLGGHAQTSDNLLVHFIDVGQGDCILIQFPDGKDMLIDCGNKSSGFKFADAEEYIREQVKDDQLDYMMLTHGDEDHVEYLDDILEDFQVDNIFMPNIKAAPLEIKSGDSQTTVDKKTAKNAKLAEVLETEKAALFTDEDTLNTEVYLNFFVAALSEPGCNIKINMDPDDLTNSIKLEGEGYNLTFYCPTESFYEENHLSDAHEKNAVSPIGILEFNGFRIVLTGDSNNENEPEFVNRVGGRLDCDVLKVAHHGSETSSTPAFLDTITCEYAVISCKAAGNNFNHPRQATLDRFIERNMDIYRTDTNGTILLTVGVSLEFTAQKPVDQAVNRVGYSSSKA